MPSYAHLSRAQLLRRLQAASHSRVRARASATKRALAESEARMRAVLETAVEGIVTIDTRGRIESVNPAAERIFGYTQDELLGRNVHVLMPSPYREGHDGYLANYLRSGVPHIIGIGREVVGLRRDGTTFPMELSVSDVRFGKQRLFTGFIRDITERKRLEQEILHISERERQRIGHDLHDGLGQHLAGIEMMSQALGQKLRKRSWKEARLSDQIASHVRAAIDQTRALARGLSPVVVEAGGLPDALRDLAAQTQSVFGVRCRVLLRTPVNLSIHTAALHLFRIAQEAVSNAIKHGKARSIVLTLRTDADALHLRIQDNGTGLPRSTPQTPGMGLRIMQYRARMIGGHCLIQSLPRKGTRVDCQVPIPASTPHASRQTQ